MNHLVVMVSLSLPALAANGLAAPGEVLSCQKISDTQGNFDGIIFNVAHFGSSSTSVGDLDGDGVIDLVIGEHHDPDDGIRTGAVWILFMNTDGTVKSHQKISDYQGNFTGELDPDDRFGISVAALGDLDDDGVIDIAVGTFNDDDGANNVGAIWILFLNTDGTVKSHQKISATEGNFTGMLNLNDRFGRSLCYLGDLDGDGVEDLAAGAIYDDDGGLNHGAVWILFLNTDGTVKSHQKISSTEGNFTGTLIEGERLGMNIAYLGDFDGDSVTELAVGAWASGDGGEHRGAVWILFLNSDGTVKSHQKISDLEGNFTGILDDGDRFGISTASLGDLDGDGVCDLAVGAVHDDDGGFDRGAVWILFLNLDGTVKFHQKISSTSGNFTGVLNDEDEFGRSVLSLGDLDGDGRHDLAVGAVHDDDGGIERGAVWVLFLDGICIWDLDADGLIGITDFLELLAVWGTEPCGPPDFDGDATVGITDFLELLANWGLCPAP